MCQYSHLAVHFSQRPPFFSLLFWALSRCLHQEIEVHLHSEALIYSPQTSKCCLGLRLKFKLPPFFQMGSFFFLNIFLIQEKFQNFSVFLKNFCMPLKYSVYFWKKEKIHPTAKMPLDKTTLRQNFRGKNVTERKCNRTKFYLDTM